MASDEVTRLNLGAGGQRAKGWVSIDRAGPDLDYKLNIVNGLPFADGEVGMAVAHHLLDLLDASDLDILLDHVHRVLAPGAVLRISLFDIRCAVIAVDRKDREWFSSRGAPDVDLGRQYRWMIYQNGARKWLTTPFLLGLILEAHGFASYEVAVNQTVCADPSICCFDSREGESMFIDAEAK